MKPATQYAALTADALRGELRLILEQNKDVRETVENSGMTSEQVAMLAERLEKNTKTLRRIATVLKHLERFTERKVVYVDFARAA